MHWGEGGRCEISSIKIELQISHVENTQNGGS